MDGVDERDLLLDPRNPMYCFYDAHHTFNANYICEQGMLKNHSNNVVLFCAVKQL